ncbi:MAG: PRC-barrel domain-containing protein [Pseudohongiellaceae bacterium]
MKKLHSIAFYALATPVITLGAGPVLAQSAEQGTYGQQQNTQRDKGAMQPKTSQGAQGSKDEHGASRTSPLVTEGDDSKSRAGQSDPKAAQSSQSSADRLNASNQARKENKGFISSAPARGMHTTNLIGAKVKTTSDVDVGPVNDLIIDENGQVVAIVVSVGGFLGMGEREVAIGWDDVTRSGSSDELVLQIDASRDELRSAPEFKKLDK